MLGQPFLEWLEPGVELPYEVGDLRGLWPPATATGRVVVTTRRHDAALRGPGRRVIEVGVFTPDEAHSYLHGALAEQPHLLDEPHDDDPDSDGVGRLARELGYLPLALAQAVAYMVDRNLTCGACRGRLADRRRRFASLVPEGEGLPDEHRATVAVTWSLSVEQANQLTPTGLADPLLAVASVLDANGIPLEVFTAAAVLALLSTATGREVLGEDAVDGLGCLQRLSLITLDPHSSARAVRVHALVQRATRDRLPQDRLAVIVCAAADALLRVWPDIERDTAVGQVLRANTDALADVGGQHLWEPDAHPVLFRAGRSLRESSGVAQAHDYFQRLHSTATERLGPDHPDTLLARDYLANWRGTAGDPAGAAAAYEELLTDQLRVLGPDHPNTLTTRNNLAAFRGKAGDPAGAAAAYEELLTDEVRALGPDHPDTLMTRANLARWRGHAGDPTDAAAALEEVLTDHVRVFGPEHLNTLATRHYLAYWRGHAGDSAGAAAAYEELVTDEVRVLGPDHPNTLTTRHYLAYWRGHTGNPAGPETALEELLTDRQRVLGPDHPDTLRIRAYWHKRSSGDAPA